jgi:hypothetical protein
MEHIGKKNHTSKQKMCISGEKNAQPKLVALHRHPESCTPKQK